MQILYIHLSGHTFREIPVRVQVETAFPMISTQETLDIQKTWPFKPMLRIMLHTLLRDSSKDGAVWAFS